MHSPRPGYGTGRKGGNKGCIKVKRIIQFIETKINTLLEHWFQSYIIDFSDCNYPSIVQHVQTDIQTHKTTAVTLAVYVHQELIII